MDLKKSGIGVLAALTGFLTACTNTAQPFSGIGLWNKVLWFGTLGFLGYSAEGPMVGFMRIAVFILVFTLFFEGSRFLGFLGRNSRIVIALILSLISVIFIPGNVLAGIGAAYGTLVALVLLGSVILGMGWGYMSIPTTSIGYRLLRVALLLVLLFILISVKQHASGLLALGPMTVNFPFP
ncbi:hypothetical protein HQ489_00050 [Candidatus Woesearchaeota archaeon]|nr:hypothetical protein [Candidatus Woesearchaeota archaeon]